MLETGLIRRTGLINLGHGSTGSVIWPRTNKMLLRWPTPPPSFRVDEESLDFINAIVFGRLPAMQPYAAFWHWNNLRQAEPWPTSLFASQPMILRACRSDHYGIEEANA